MHSIRIALAAFACIAGLPAFAANQYGQVEFANSGAAAPRRTSSTAWRYYMILSTTLPPRPFGGQRPLIRDLPWRTGARR